VSVPLPPTTATVENSGTAAGVSFEPPQEISSRDAAMAAYHRAVLRMESNMNVSLIDWDCWLVDVGLTAAMIILLGSDLCRRQ
jgi:hypothetical protein